MKLQEVGAIYAGGLHGDDDVVRSKTGEFVIDNGALKVSAAADRRRARKARVSGESPVGRASPKAGGSGKAGRNIDGSLKKRCHELPYQPSAPLARAPYAFSKGRAN